MVLMHREQLAAHGGLPGIRDDAALGAALDRARNKWWYEAQDDRLVLAAAYAFAIARSHPFNDGNKRTAFLAMVTFLGLNGLDLVATDAEVVTAFVALAAGDLDEAELSEWLRTRTRVRRRR